MISNTRHSLSLLCCKTKYLLACLALTMASLDVLSSEPQGQTLDLKKNQHISIIGNGFAEGMHLHGWLETALHALNPDLQLQIRNMGWQADTVGLRERPYKFGNMLEHLSAQKTDVIIACYGMNESFEGDAGLETFEAQLTQWVETLNETDFGGQAKTQIVLVSPIAHENLGAPLPNGEKHNEDLKKYTETMAKVAEALNIVFIDLFNPSLQMYSKLERPLTQNGIHPNAFGYWHFSQEILRQLGYELSQEDSGDPKDLDALRTAVWDKNWHFFMRWRPVNMEYIRGERREPYGVENFPREFEMLDQMIAERDKTIWQLSRKLNGQVFFQEPIGKAAWETTPYYDGPSISTATGDNRE